jgi:hypothetical protein
LAREQENVNILVQQHIHHLPCTYLFPAVSNPFFFLFAPMQRFAIWPFSSLRIWCRLSSPQNIFSAFDKHHQLLLWHSFMLSIFCWPWCTCFGSTYDTKNHEALRIFCPHFSLLSDGVKQIHEADMM